MGLPLHWNYLRKVRDPRSLLKSIGLFFRGPFSFPLALGNLYEPEWSSQILLIWNCAKWKSSPLFINKNSSALRFKWGHWAIPSSFSFPFVGHWATGEQKKQGQYAKVDGTFPQSTRDGKHQFICIHIWSNDQTLASEGGRIQKWVI